MKNYFSIYTALLTACALCLSAFAASPSTGDYRGQMMGVVIGVGVVALVVILILAALGGKKKGGKGKKK